MKQLNKSEIEKLNAEIAQQVGILDFFDKKARIELDEREHVLFVLQEKMPVFFYHEGKLVPTLKLLLQRPLLKQVVVDMGAVKFVSGGADVMRPGIVDLDHEMKKDELVVIVDQTHKKPLAIGRALFSGEEIFRMEKGKVIAIVHHVGDAIWNAFG